MVPIVSFVGWSGSGKTTLIGKLIASFTRSGFHVGAVKSTHRAVDLDKKGSDSAHFSASGAERVCLVSLDRTYLFCEQGPQTAADLENLFPGADIILCEGLVVDGSLVVEVTAESDGNRGLKYPPESLVCVVKTSPQGPMEENRAGKSESGVRDAAYAGIPVFDGNGIEPIQRFLEEQLWKEK